MAPPVYGVEQLGFVRTQSAHDTISAFSGSHAFGFISMEIKPERALIESAEHVGTASLQGQYKGKLGGTWSVECYEKITAAATALPHGAFLLGAGFTFSGGIYALNADQPTSLQIGRKTGSGLYELASGAWVEKIEVELGGDKVALFRASGGFSTYGYLGGNVQTAAGSVSSSATSVSLAAADEWKVLPGARVAFGAEDNSGAGYLVTAVADDGVTMTISPGLVNGISGGVNVTPVVPTPTIAGTVIGGVSDGFSVDGTSMGLIMGKMTLETGIHGLAKECTTDRANRLGRGKRRLSFEGEMYYLDENAHIIGGAYQTVETRALIMRAGANTSGVRILHNVPKTPIKMTSPDVPDADEATVKFASVAQQSSAADDEFTIDTN